MAHIFILSPNATGLKEISVNPTVVKIIKRNKSYCHPSRYKLSRTKSDRTPCDCPKVSEER